MGQAGYQPQVLKSIALQFYQTMQGPGYKLLVHKKTREEHLLLTRLLHRKEEYVQQQLNLRLKVKGRFIPELLQYGREHPHYCSETSVVHMLFKRPARSLLSELNQRRAIGEWFDEGEVMMIVFCVLEALTQFKRAKLSQNIQINENNLYVSNSGAIILSDTDNYGETANNKKSKSLKTLGEDKFSEQVKHLRQLGQVLQRIDRGGNYYFQQHFRLYKNDLVNGSILTYGEGVQRLYALRKYHQKLETKQDQLKKSQEQAKPQHLNSVEQKQNHHEQITKAKQTRRQPLKEIKAYANRSDINSKTSALAQKVSDNWEPFSSKTGAKDNFGPQETGFQEVGGRLDELSSIVEVEISRQDDEEQSVKGANILDTSQNQERHATIELVCPSRPERLKQLILNQPEIIYEESADELSSLPSHRTFRIKSICSQ